MAMASLSHIITPLITITTCFILAYTASSKDIFVPVGGSETNNTGNGTRMIGDCWTALYDVKSCRNEIASYFNNGTIDIGLSCCQAIKFITQECWLNLLNVLGIPVKESNVLRGYCDVTYSVLQALPDIINGTTV